MYSECTVLKKQAKLFKYWSQPVLQKHNTSMYFRYPNKNLTWDISSNIALCHLTVHPKSSPSTDNIYIFWSFMINVCIVLRGRVILDELILSIPLSGRAIFQNTLSSRSYISQYIILKYGVLKYNSTILPSSKGYISQYTPSGVSC